MKMKKTMMVIFSILLLLIFGCSKDSSTNPEVRDLSGTWEFFRTENGNPELSEGLVLVLHENSELLLSFEDDFSISLSISGDDVQGSFIDGNGVDTITISGSVNNSNELSGSWSSSSGDSGTWRMVKISDSTTPPEGGWSSLKVYGLNEGAYEIWVSNQSYLDEPNYWNYYYSVSEYNFFKKGESASGGITNINGKFKYYVIAVPDETVIDAVEFDENDFLSSSINWDWGNLTENEGNIYGAPDGAGATIDNGFIVIENSYYTLPSVSSNYQVWGGNEGIGGENGYHPEDNGYTFILESDSNSTFDVQFEYYLIVVHSNSFILLDAVGGNDGMFYGTNTTGGTQNWQNVSGQPDGKSAMVGLMPEGQYDGGYVLIHPSDSSTELTVFIGN